MKFYETHYEEYIHTSEKYNLHPEMSHIYDTLPNDINNFGNLIIYGPSGAGKYTQSLKLIKKYSHSHLKYDKKIKIQTDKQSYVYRISDIHYEIDMSLLGCNSKLLWNEIFLQIVDIISVKNDKKGFIVCKNFHFIHTELLEIFYSYIQQYNHIQTTIQIRFIIITEHISFLPNNILNCCNILSVIRPTKTDYNNMVCQCETNNQLESTRELIKDPIVHFTQRIINLKSKNSNKVKSILKNIEPQEIINMKELYSFSLMDDTNDIPSDIFNIICDNIIKEMENYEEIVFSNFRDIIYDILIYNLDVSECLWYILNHFIKKDKLKEKSISEILEKMYVFLKYYNNNYRPIYHIESILFCIINKLYM